MGGLGKLSTPSAMLPNLLLISSIRSVAPDAIGVDPGLRRLQCACPSSAPMVRPMWCAGHLFPLRGRSSTPKNLEQVRSVGPFDGWLRGAVVQFKYHGEWARAPHLSERLAVAVAHTQRADGPYRCPSRTPLDSVIAGFNQSLLPAKHTGGTCWESRPKRR